MRRDRTWESPPPAARSNGVMVYHAQKLVPGTLAAVPRVIIVEAACHRLDLLAGFDEDLAVA